MAVQVVPQGFTGTERWTINMLDLKLPLHGARDLIDERSASVADVETHINWQGALIPHQGEQAGLHERSFPKARRTKQDRQRTLYNQPPEFGSFLPPPVEESFRGLIECGETWPRVLFVDES